MHGLLLLDKPAGLTSHDCVRQVRRLFKTRKVGHAGTLDPLATGVLPIAIGNATKILQFLLAEDKSYRATFKLGITTDTLDSDGQIVLQRPVPSISRQSLADICARFTGEIDQQPPMYSALKKDGVPLYKLARQGKEIERPTRRIKIFRLDIIESVADQVTIEVDCSKGTYIRSLAHDIGEVLGCGAHITSLRRLWTGPFSIDECTTLEELGNTADKQQFLISADSALRNLPAVVLNDSGLARLKFGIPPQVEEVALDLTPEPGVVVRLQAAGELVAMARYAPLRENEKRGDFELIRVFVSH